MTCIKYMTGDRVSATQHVESVLSQHQCFTSDTRLITEEITQYRIWKTNSTFIRATNVYNVTSTQGNPIVMNLLIKEKNKV